MSNDPSRQMEYKRVFHIFTGIYSNKTSIIPHHYTSILRELTEGLEKLFYYTRRTKCLSRLFEYYENSKSIFCFFRVIKKKQFFFVKLIYV